MDEIGISPSRTRTSTRSDGADLELIYPRPSTRNVSHGQQPAPKHTRRVEKATTPSTEGFNSPAPHSKTKLNKTYDRDRKNKHFLDDKWGKDGYLPPTRFLRSHDNVRSLGSNQLSYMKSITTETLTDGVDLHTLYEPGGVLYQAMLNGGKRNSDTGPIWYADVPKVARGLMKNKNRTDNAEVDDSILEDNHDEEGLPVPESSFTDPLTTTSNSAQPLPVPVINAMCEVIDYFQNNKPHYTLQSLQDEINRAQERSQENSTELEKCKQELDAHRKLTKETNARLMELGQQYYKYSDMISGIDKILAPESIGDPASILPGLSLEPHMVQLRSVRDGLDHDRAQCTEAMEKTRKDRDDFFRDLDCCEERLLTLDAKEQTFAKDLASLESLLPLHLMIDRAVKAMAPATADEGGGD